MEEWKAIDGYSGYLVSNYGRVKSFKRKNEIIKTQFIVDRYMALCLYTDTKKRVIRKVHRLVAEAFIPNPENKPIVDHIDGNISNNVFYNLRWATSAENNHNRRGSVSYNGKKCTSKYKGVFFHKRDKKWISSISINRKRLHLGYFTTEEEAHKAYDKKAKELHGEFYCE